MTAAERFKRLYANAVELVCVLEERLEVAEHDLAEAKKLLAETPSGVAAKANPDGRSVEDHL